MNVCNSHALTLHPFSKFSSISAGVNVPFLTPFMSGSISRSRSMSSPLNWRRRFSGSFSPSTWAELGQQQQWQQAPSASATGAGPDSDAVFSGQPGALALHWSLKHRGLSASPSFPSADAFAPMPLELVQFDPELQTPLQATALHRSVTSDSIRGESLQVDGATQACAYRPCLPQVSMRFSSVWHVLLPGAGCRLPYSSSQSLCFLLYCRASREQVP